MRRYCTSPECDALSPAVFIHPSGSHDSELILQGWRRGGDCWYCPRHAARALEQGRHALWLTLLWVAIGLLALVWLWRCDPQTLKRTLRSVACAHAMPTGKKSPTA
jgi:hypothetical protein